MSKNLIPIPVGNPVLDNPNAFNIAWQKYLKAIGDDLLTANLVKNVTEQIPDPNNPSKMITVNTGLQYTINANICACVFNKQLVADKVIALPYPSLLAFEFNGAVLPAGTKNITVPVAVQFLQFWYIVDFAR